MLLSLDDSVCLFRHFGYINLDYYCTYAMCLYNLT